MYKKQLGGLDYNGNLCRKHYHSERDSYVQYNTWEGVVIESNEQLDMLFHSHPNCEAIRFDCLKMNGEDENFFKLSDRIGEFIKLKYLEIHSNRIYEYPRTIENLVNLEELVIHLNNKEEIEFNFSRLISLKHLTINSALDLKEFPISIYTLKQLESLKLFGFSNIELNEELSNIEKLENLKELFLFSSLSLKLPENYIGNNNLVTLILLDYKWELPKGIYNILSLRRLGLGGIKSINLSYISNLKNLESLSLISVSNFIDKITLPLVEHLELSSFQGENIDLGISTLQNLKSLIIWSCNQIKQLDKLSNNTLQCIIINANNNLEKIIIEEDKLISLKQITLKSNPNLKFEKERIASRKVRR